MMMRPPSGICLSAAWVVTNTPRTLISITRSSSSSVASSNGFGIAVPALFTSTSMRPKAFDNLIHSSLHGFGIRGVGLYRERLAAAALDGLDDRIGGLRILGIGNRDIRAF